ncbi:hypothetical protein QBB31_13970 [Streptomyces scabiei]|uniref:hypothetical protein n=1 Tax=Streptomyces scabiei TaxID=1930 RepID=UPI002FF2BB02
MLITDAAVREAAAHLAQSLGGDWAIDTEAPADGAAHLVYSDGRGISFRPIFGGTTVQLWITGSAVSPLPEGAALADQALYEAHVAARLPEGHRYNQSTTLVTEADEDPEHIILRTLEDALLPAFECKPRYVGHRPWIDLFDNALAAATAEREAPSAADDHGHDHAEVEPAPQDGVEPNSEAESNVYSEPDGGGEEAATEEPALLKQASEEAPSPEPDTEPEAAQEPTSNDAGNGNDTTDQPVSEPNPATSRRPRKRNPKRRTTASATESTS